SRAFDGFNFAVGWCGGTASNKLYIAEIKLDGSINIEEIYSSKLKLSETYWGFATKSFTAAFVERATLKNGGKNCILSFICSGGYAPDPNPKIVRPRDDRLYIRDHEIKICTQDTFVIGKITIEVEENPLAVDKVVFYLDGNVRAIETEPNKKGLYSWTWNERAFAGHTLTVRSFGSNGKVKERMATICILNLFPQSYWD
ncbi:MAG: Ig-like domain-containing protein, partial [Petrotogales bacterium]